ncbi:glycosyltransferase family 2 protein [Novipirellula sp. SH528]|uniref:glycosyltransferase family 2 protein n=1 Tax=Novipirellula sp. SH528 TaxID=3454466 RepID=UPI003F9F7D5C
MMTLSLIAVVLAFLPAVMFLRNLPLFRLPDSQSLAAEGAYANAATRAGKTRPDAVSVLIPARNEADSIAACVQAALASTNIDVEVLVLDDDSDDATASIVSGLAQIDKRVRCISGAPLPDGWNGKQHACWQLAAAAKHPRLLFLDADVRLEPHAIEVLVDWQNTHAVALLSAFPQQETGALLEKLLIPMMHYILLGFLPMARMRASSSPAYAAGCGQLFLTLHSDYVTAGTHQAIKSSRHDGVKLPRVYRQSGMMTDVVDGTFLARCRMYRDGGEVIRGLLKNATEGIANPKVIGLFTVLIIGASVLPIVAFLVAVLTHSSMAMSVAGIAVVVSHLPRAIAAVNFRQPIVGVVLHSVAATLFIGLQWSALAMSLLGKQVRWRGRL